MSPPVLARLSACALAAVLATSALTAPGADAVRPAERARGGNPTGTAAGSLPNGAGYLKVALSTTRDGQIKVRWKRPAPPARLKGFVVRVGVNRSMDAKVRAYAVNRKRQSIVVPPAFGATRASGNFSFVKVTVKRRNGTHGSSPAKWIQTPLAAGCPSGTDRVTVGTFNVRSWGADQRTGNTRFTWRVRGDRVVRDILRSGAGAVAIQEASGRPHQGYGSKRQSRWILNHLNAEAPQARWVDALREDAYTGEGLTGTRVFYDAARFTKLDAGFIRIRDRAAPTAYAPWARLRGVGGSTSPFVLISTHLANGDGPHAAAARDREVQQIIELARSLRSRYGGQVILGGDFNSTVNTKPYNTVQRALLHAGFYDAFATRRLVNSRYGTTNNFHFPVRPSPYRRDYLMVLGDTQGSCRYVNLAYTHARRAASDHFMQVATLPLSG